MAAEGIATLPMQDIQAPQESQGIGAFQQQSAAPEVTEKDRFEAVMAALSKQLPDVANKVEQILNQASLTPEQVEGLSQLIQLIEKNKDNYPALIQTLGQQGIIDPSDFPPQYSEEFMVMLKMVVYGYQLRNQQPQPVPFKKGGLAEAARALASKGRNGDTILAHINPAEAVLLKQRGGSGTINPHTGLPEFGFFDFVAAPFKAVGSAIGAVGSAVGGAVKSVVGAVSKVLGPQVTSVLATVGGFMIGGPAGAALASGLVTYGQGGSLKDVLLNSATAYIGGTYGPTAGAIAGGASTMLKGGSLKDAIKAAALSGAMSYAGQNAGQLIGPQLQSVGEWLNGTPTTPEVSTGGVSIPSNVNAANITNQGGSIASPSEVTGTTPTGGATVPASDATNTWGINAGPAPTVGGTQAPSAGIGSLNLPKIDLTSAAPGATTSGISGASAATPGAGFWNNLTSGNLTQAAGNAWDWAQAYPKTAIAGGLGIMGLAGGFTPKPSQPTGLTTPNITGETLMGQNPSKYVVQGMPGVSYNPQGGIDYTGQSAGYEPNPAFEQSKTYTPQRYGYTSIPTPNYPVPGGAATTRQANQSVPQPYNTPNMYNFMYSPYLPRYAATGGDMQYPRRTGQIAGPGTETSDSIPAMLSDGEFVITAKAVRGIGNGSRREGAKKLYRMMHAMEKKAGGSV